MNVRRLIKWVLLALTALVILVIAGIYYILFHTALPFKLVAAAFSSNPGCSVTGVSGSVSTGFRVASIQYQNPAGGTSRIEDVRLDYNGLWDLMRHNRLIIRNFQVGKAHLYLDLSKNDKSDSGSTRPANTSENGLKLFQINRLSIADVLLKDPVTEFEISIPAVELTGFKVENGKVELGLLKVQSDRLDIQSHDGQSVTIGNKTVAFQKAIEGAIKPLLHKTIRQPIRFHADLSIDNNQKPICRLRAFDDKLELFAADNQDGYLRCQGLELAKYINVQPYDLPANLSLDIAILNDPSRPRKKITVQSGQFNLGASQFTVQPGEAGPSVIAVCGTADTMFSYLGSYIKEENRFRQRLMASPAMEPQEILARVFFAKPFSQLSPDQRRQTEERLPIYFPSPATTLPALDVDGVEKAK